MPDNALLLNLPFHAFSLSRFPRKPRKQLFLTNFIYCLPLSSIFCLLAAPHLVGAGLVSNCDSDVERRQGRVKSHTVQAVYARRDNRLAMRSIFRGIHGEVELVVRVREGWSNVTRAHELTERIDLAATSGDAECSRDILDRSV